MQQSVEVPQTPLHTSRVLHEEQDVWEKVKVSVGHFAAASLDAQKLLWIFFFYLLKN